MIKQLARTWIGPLLFYAMIVIFAWARLAQAYNLEFLDALPRIWTDYKLVFLFGHMSILAGLILGEIYIYRISNHPEKRYSGPEAMRRHTQAKQIASLIAGPAFLLGFLGLVCGISSIWMLTLVLFGLSFFFLLRNYMVYLRKCCVKTVEEVMATGIPPVLYLRSFIDDDKAANLYDIDATEEEEITQALETFGPLIAIGQPGEKLPDLGAARAYFADDEWQAAVHHYLQISNLVVLRAGFSQGLLWEIKNVIQRVDPRRIVLLIPFARKKYDRFRQYVQGCFPNGLPEHSGQIAHYTEVDQDGSTTPWKFGSLLGVIHFDIEWDAHFEPLQMTDRKQYTNRRVMHMLQAALVPVAQKLDQ